MADRIISPHGHLHERLEFSLADVQERLRSLEESVGKLGAATYPSGTAGSPAKRLEELEKRVYGLEQRGNAPTAVLTYGPEEWPAPQRPANTLTEMENHREENRRLRALVDRCVRFLVDYEVAGSDDLLAALRSAQGNR